MIGTGTTAMGFAVGGDIELEGIDVCLEREGSGGGFTTRRHQGVKRTLAP